MSNSEKDQNVMGSFLKFATSPLQDRRLIANNHDVAPSPIRRLDPNYSESDGNIKPKKKREDENHGPEKENCVLNSVAVAGEPPLKVKLPPETGRGRDRGEDEPDGFRTPTAAQQKIPAIKTCPPPPRKPAMKRRAPVSRRRVLLDLSNEIESLFPPAIHKRIRQ